MKAQELRIGNWVVNVDEYWEVRLVDFNSMYIEKSCPFKPIPLTEEWLLKFGFNKKGESRYGFKYIYPIADWGFTIEPSFEEGKWFFGHEFYDSGDDAWDYQSLNFCFDLQYVHTLQNLYFALTGEELNKKD